MEIDIDNIRNWIALLVALSTILGFYFNTRSRLSQQKKEIDDLKIRINSIEKKYYSFKESLAVIDERQLTTNKTLDEIKRLLNRNITRTS